MMNLYERYRRNGSEIYAHLQSYKVLNKKEKEIAFNIT